MIVRSAFWTAVTSFFTFSTAFPQTSVYSERGTTIPEALFTYGVAINSRGDLVGTDNLEVYPSVANPTV
jgi:hypothetical protein